MSARGFTTIELLVALGMMLTATAIIYQGVRPQVQNAGVLVRMAEMQQATRGAFDLLARDMRMAGYGVDLTVPGIPSPLKNETGKVVVLNGNFTNVKTIGSGAGSTVAVASTAGFIAGNYLVIRSFWGTEVARITGVGSSSIQLATPLTRVHPVNSEVHQIERIRYEMASDTLKRETQPMMDAVGNITLQYYLDDGTLVSDPVGIESDVRTALIDLDAHTIDPAPQSAPIESMNVRAEVRVRNLGLFEVRRNY